MKKKILFIVSNMEGGGVSKSISSLLNVIDTTTYQVDCFILSPNGVFMSTIPPGVNIISEERTSLLFSRFPQNIIPLLKKGFILNIIIRLLAAAFMLVDKGIGGWILSRRIYIIREKYDLAIDYNGQHQLYYLIDKISAEKKVTFFHSDYSQWDYYYRIDKKYLPKADHIFTISEQCVQSLKKYFPNCDSKIDIFENISSVSTLQQMAAEQVADPLNYNGFKLITVGRITESKGVDLAIKAAKVLKDKGICFMWYFVGKQDDPNYIKALIKQNGIESHITFLGLKSNPYPYVKSADILVHTSRFEGKSIALDEAKILAKPVVVTNFSTVVDQFTHRYNATIVGMNAKEIADAIEELLFNPKLAAQYVSNLTKDRNDNTNEINKLYRLLA